MRGSRDYGILTALSRGKVSVWKTPPWLPPFPYFGGKRTIVPMVWERFGQPKHYIEPFCGSAAMLLGKPQEPASLEVIGDWNGFIANFWRATIHQPEQVARFADYPVIHMEQTIRHRWLLDRRQSLTESLADPDFPGDPKIAGWWLWGQCSWIGHGWCEWDRDTMPGNQVPFLGNAGRGVQAVGQTPHISNAGMGIQAIGQIPQINDAGRGIQAAGKALPRSDESPYWTPAGEVAAVWLRRLASRMGRVRVIHGDWGRGLNHHYGGEQTAIFFDPPYKNYTDLYGSQVACIADEVAAWAAKHPHLRIALCGHVGDYDLPGWDAVQWSRGRTSYGSTKTTDMECIWFSPACLKPVTNPIFDLFCDEND